MGKEHQVEVPPWDDAAAQAPSASNAMSMSAGVRDWDRVQHHQIEVSIARSVAAALTAAAFNKGVRSSKWQSKRPRGSHAPAFDDGSEDERTGRTRNSRKHRFR